jgi:hypothetical protein
MCSTGSDLPGQFGTTPGGPELEREVKRRSAAMQLSFQRLNVAEGGAERGMRWDLTMSRMLQRH